MDLTEQCLIGEESNRKVQYDTTSLLIIHSANQYETVGMISLYLCV